MVQQKGNEDLGDIQERLEIIREKEEGGKVENVPEFVMEPVEKIDIIKKILVIGDSGVGKKTILGKVAPFRKDWERYANTIGTAITKYGRSYSFETADIKLLIIVWDITGQEDYRRMSPSYYKGGEGLLVMADAHDPESIDNLPNWIRAAYKVTDRIPTVVIINKVDLVPEANRKELDRKVREVLAGYEVPIYYLTKDSKLVMLGEPFFQLAEMISDRVRLQLAKKRYKRSQIQQ